MRLASFGEFNLAIDEVIGLKCWLFLALKAYIKGNILFVLLISAAKLGSHSQKNGK